jgi:hypothetical protein
MPESRPPLSKQEPQRTEGCEDEPRHEHRMHASHASPGRSVFANTGTADEARVRHYRRASL